MGGAPAIHAQSNKIILGQSAAFSGPAAQLGIQYHAGAKLYFDSLNASGGIGGRSVEIRQMDDGYEPERCAANTKALLESNVLALFGYIGTPTSLAALPLSAAANVSFFAPFTGAMALRTAEAKNAFHIRASYNDETSLIVKTIFNATLRRVAVFYQNDAYGKAGLEGVRLALEKFDLKPVAIATVERNTVDVAKAVATINAAKPDAVVQITAYKSSAAFVRETRKAGYSGGLYNVSFVGTQALAEELGSVGAGIVISQVVPSPYRQANEISREFATTIAKANQLVSSNFSSMEGFLAAKVLAEGLRRGLSKGGGRDGMVAGLESIGSTSFGGFMVDFSGKERAASKYVELSMLTGDGKVRT